MNDYDHEKEQELLEEVMQRLEEGQKYCGHAQSLYQTANDVFTDYTQRKAEGKNRQALEQLGIVKMYLEKAEQDMIRRNSYDQISSKQRLEGGEQDDRTT